MRKQLGLKMIRRTNCIGHHYFIANLTNKDIATTVPLGISDNHGIWYNPMTGEYHEASFSDKDIQLNLKSGESRILITSNKPVNEWKLDSKVKVGGKETITAADSKTIDLTANAWNLSFTEEAPKVGETFNLKGLKSWENLSEKAKVMMGTGVYETTFKLSKDDALKQWAIDLGDVRESARVYINNKYVGCAWAVPYILNCKDALNKGKNTIRIEVTNLPANRIAELDRQGVKWRKMKEINVVDINYKKTTYEKWTPVPSGLNSSVKLVELKIIIINQLVQMKKLILTSLCILMGMTTVSAQNATVKAAAVKAASDKESLMKEILEVSQRTNNYFMAKYSDPTLDTYVKKVRTSNLWTRAVYYEGLMALYEIDPQQRYLDYTDRWADYHKWTARGSVNDTDADNQCCQQTYIDRYIQTGGKRI